MKQGLKKLSKIFFIIGTTGFIVISIFVFSVDFYQKITFSKAIKVFQTGNTKLATKKFLKGYRDFGSDIDSYQKASLIGLALVRVKQKDTGRLNNIYEEFEIVFDEETAKALKERIELFRMGKQFDIGIPGLGEKERALIKQVVMELDE